MHKLATQSRVAGAIGFLYGQRHSKELDFAQKNCSKLNIDFYLADISALSPMFGNNSLTDRNVEVPEGRYYESNMKSTVVPNRNMIMLSLAAARAIAVGAQAVAYAERPFVGMTKADIVRLGADLGVDFSLTWS